MSVITGRTKNLAVIGYPIHHSLSPTMQNAALGRAGLDYVYAALSVAPDNLAAAVAGLKALEFRGFNVTIPHKTTVMKYLDEVDSSAQIIGAVNTVVNDDGRLKGYNTDALGFIHALRDAGFTPRDKCAVVLGAGGAAKAVTQSLLAAQVAELIVGARNGEKAHDFAKMFAAHGNVCGFEWKSAEFVAALSRADLLVNTTPLGMCPNVDAMPPLDLSRLKTSAFVYDIIYTPAQTRLLKEAASAGHRTLNGENMLVWQGAEAFRLWTGRMPDTELMMNVLREQLRSNR